MEIVNQLLESDEARLQAVEMGVSFLTRMAVGYLARESLETDIRTENFKGSKEAAKWVEVDIDEENQKKSSEFPTITSYTVLSSLTDELGETAGDNFDWSASDYLETGATAFAFTTGYFHSKNL